MGCRFFNLFCTAVWGPDEFLVCWCNYTFSRCLFFKALLGILFPLIVAGHFQPKTKITISLPRTVLWCTKERGGTTTVTHQIWTVFTIMASTLHTLMASSGKHGKDIIIPLRGLKWKSDHSPFKPFMVTVLMSISNKIKLNLKMIAQISYYM